MTTQEDMQNVQAAIANSVMSVENAAKVLGSWERLKAKLNEAHSAPKEEDDAESQAE